MSQLPPYQPIPYASGYLQPPNPRPTSVTVIAVLAIIFGSIGVLGGLCGLPALLGARVLRSPMMNPVYQDSFVTGIQILRLIVGLAVSILLLWAGIAALSLKPPARKGLIVYGWAQIVLTLVSLPLQLFYIQPRMMHNMQNLGANPGLSAGQTNMIVQAGVFFGAFVGLLSLVWPVLIIYYMKRPHVIAAFERGNTPDAPLPPPTYDH